MEAQYLAAGVWSTAASGPAEPLTGGLADVPDRIVEARGFGLLVRQVLPYGIHPSSLTTTASVIAPPASSLIQLGTPFVSPSRCALTVEDSIRSLSRIIASQGARRTFQTFEQT